MLPLVWPAMVLASSGAAVASVTPCLIKRANGTKKVSANGVQRLCGCENHSH